MSFIQLGSGYEFLNKNPIQILNIITNQTHHNDPFCSSLFLYFRFPHILSTALMLKEQLPLELLIFSNLDISVHHIFELNSTLLYSDPLTVN
jgi:hypothetical protein